MNTCELIRHLRTNEKEFFVSTPNNIKEEIEEGSSKNEDEDNLRKIIRHPQNKSLAVIGKPAIYVRESYEDLYHLMINRASEGSDHKFLVTGTSGIGKSCFFSPAFV